MSDDLITVDPSVFNNDGMEDFFTKDVRRTSTFRQVLEALGIPLPQWAERKPAGRKPGIRHLVANRTMTVEEYREYMATPAQQRRTQRAVDKALMRDAKKHPEKYPDGVPVGADNLYANLFPQVG